MMGAIKIGLQQFASQQFEVSLNEQSCTIGVHQRNDSVYVDLYVNSQPVVLGALARNRVGLTRHAYLPFKGELMFVDMQGEEDPRCAGLGERWLLVFSNDLTPTKL